MKTSLKKLNPCRWAVSVEVDAQEVEASFKEAFQKIQKKAKLQGFRPGKVPLNMVEQTFGDTAKEEVVQDMVGRKYSEAIAKHNVHPMSYPAIRDLSIERGQPCKFVAEFDVPPQIKLKKYKGMKLVRPSAKVTDKEVDRTLKSFQESRGTLKATLVDRPVQEEDFVECEIEILKDGKTVQPKQKTQLRVQKMDGHEELFAGLVGMKFGETKEIAAKENVVYRVLVNAIKVQDLPTLDDEFAKSFGKESVEDLKKSIEQDLARYYEEQAKERMKEQLFTRLIDENAFAVPESLVDRQAKRILEKVPAQGKKLTGQEQEKLEQSARERAERQVRLFFILEKIAQDAKVEPGESDLETRIQEIAKATQQSADDIRKKLSDDIRQELRQTKVVDHVLAQAQVSEEEKS